MGVQKYKCEQCNSWFYETNAGHNWQDPGADDRKKAQFDLSGIHEGTYNSRFCCKSCADEWAAAHPGESTKTLGARASLGCLVAIFKIPLLLGKLCWKIAKNKWAWTICTFGMSWATWKLLDKIYRPKN